jgi:hypothetical protein
MYAKIEIYLDLKILIMYSEQKIFQCRIENCVNFDKLTFNGFQTVPNLV